MDWERTGAAVAIGELAERILTDRCTHDRLKQLEATPGPVFDRELWTAFAEAGIAGALVPEEFGGSGLGLLDLVTVLEQLGRHVAPVPFVATAVMAADAIATHGSPGQKQALLPGLAAGSLLVTAALEESGNADLTAPTTRAERSDDGWRVTGTKDLVPYGQFADHVIVSAAGPEMPGLWIVATTGPGVRTVEQIPSSRTPLADLVMDGAPAQPLVGGAKAITWLADRGAAAVCVVQAGVCEGALQMTAEHTRTRRQFDKAIGEFQAVGQRAADAFIDTEMIRLTAWQALFRLAEGWAATEAVHGAKFWAGDAGMRVVHAAQHLHGGLGVDLDYPLHRHFLAAKQNEFTLGSPTRELVRLGARLADDPV